MKAWKVVLCEYPFIATNCPVSLASGPVVVGVLPTLPVEGVTLLLGNGIAGEKVVPYPIKSATPVSDNSRPTEELVKEMPKVFSSCAVTRSMAREQVVKVSRRSQSLVLVSVAMWMLVLKVRELLVFQRLS